MATACARPTGVLISERQSLNGATDELVYGRTYVSDVLAACVRGERAYCRVADTSARAPAVCAYALGKGVRVRVRELHVAQGGVGWRVSVGALVQAQWLATHAHVVRGRAVLELGAGLGVGGLVAAQLPGVSSVCLTDVLPELVANLEHNARLNPSAPGVDVRARLLDFRAPGTTERAYEDALLHAAAGRAREADAVQPLGDERFDLVIGAEIMYESYHALAVPALLGARLSPEAGSRALLVHVVREQSTLEPGGLLRTFVRSARAAGLVTRLVAPRHVHAQSAELVPLVFSPLDGAAHGVCAIAAGGVSTDLSLLALDLDDEAAPGGMLLACSGSPEPIGDNGTSAREHALASARRTPPPPVREAWRAWLDADRRAMLPVVMLELWRR